MTVHHTDVTRPLTPLVVGLSFLALGTAPSGAADGPPLVDRPMVTAIPGQLATHYALFRRQRTTADVLPAKALNSGDVISKLYGVNGDLSRRALHKTTKGGRIAGGWLVPGQDSLCLILSLVPDKQQVRFVSSCSPTIKQATTTRGTVGTLGGYGDLRATHRSRVYGYMPDDVKTVRITTHDGTSTHLNVRGNVFTKTFTRPVRAQYMINGKRRSLKLLTPDDPG